MSRLMAKRLAKAAAQIIPTPSKLDFGHSGGLAKRVGDAVAERGAELSHLCLSRRQEQTLLTPELPPDSADGVGEGRPRFAVPSIGAGRCAGTAVEARSEQCHDREQGEQAGGGAGDGPVRPLAVGLDAEMVAHLAEGDLHLPALDERKRRLSGTLRAS